MAIAGVGVCQHCEAVVNLHWSRCAVCAQPIETRRDYPVMDPIPSGASEAGQSIQTAFDLNAASIRKSPLVRHTRYESGQIVEITSPMVGVFQAKVLRDNGVVVWILHPFIQREVAIPSEWLIDQGQFTRKG